MQFSKISYREIPKYSKLLMDYISGESRVDSFIQYPFAWESMPNITRNIQQNPINRELLKNTVIEQYRKLKPGDKTLQNIQKLSDANTFTVTTAHQLVVLTGPLYFIYKICNVIHLAEELNKRFSHQHFVPVYWMGSEDHDFEEINHIHINGQKFEWQSNQKGSTGEFDTKDMNVFFDLIENYFSKDESARSVLEKFKSFYLTSENLTEATFKLLHDLFDDFGLVIIDGNHPDLKRAFVPVMERELTSMESDGLVQQTAKKLVESGYHAQAHSRQINLFYKNKHLRERIVFEKGKYKVNNTDLTFSQKQILNELNNHPERFSPNVILRPLFQQAILPNVMYVGGGGELAYWMQLKDVFGFYRVHYPMLVLRTSVHIVVPSMQKRISKFSLPLTSYFDEVEAVKKIYMASKDSEGILQTENETVQLKNVITSLQSKAEKIDPTLVGWVGAEGTKMEKQLEGIVSRLIKTKKAQIDTELSQLEKIVQSFTPQNSLQERVDNFLPFYLKDCKGFIKALVKHLNPMEKMFVVIED